ncbi:unnamed protein product [Caenorhabditis angaria]|uniref:Uncharacterized protein n=1 Tax=Caenorhabditis angaria TaxID=860376 RepID=A0A9P1IYP4_9PELO|nr:unnamed protein product [Caenorhabditis angaria]
MSRCSDNSKLRGSTIIMAEQRPMSSENSGRNVAASSDGGHSASPYLRRFRLPKLNTIRRYNLEDENEEDDDEWFEIQMAKTDLIKARMNERNKKLEENQQNNNSIKRTTDNSRTSSENSENASSCQQNMRENKKKRCPFFHPTHLFAAAAGPSS